MHLNGVLNRLGSHIFTSPMHLTTMEMCPCLRRESQALVSLHIQCVCYSWNNFDMSLINSNTHSLKSDKARE